MATPFESVTTTSWEYILSNCHLLKELGSNIRKSKFLEAILSIFPNTKSTKIYVEIVVCLFLLPSEFLSIHSLDQANK